MVDKSNLPSMKRSIMFRLVSALTGLGNLAFSIQRNCQTFLFFDHSIFIDLNVTVTSSLI